MRRQPIKWMLVVLALATASPAAPASADASLDLLGGAPRLSDGLYEVTLRTGPPLLTHGADMPQAGDPHGDDATGGASRPPRCAPDFHQHVLYARHVTMPDHFAESRPVIEGAIFNMNAELDRAAMESGGRHADYRLKCDGERRLVIGNVVNARSSSFADVVDAARLSGAVVDGVNYTIFYDDPTPDACGIGSYTRDDQPGAQNQSNQGGAYSVVYRDCWNGLSAMHEAGHNMGAVQPGAPNGTALHGHCRDESDVMCYADGAEGPTGMLSTCPGGARFDCGYDDYFDAQPEPGEYLASHWNLGSSVNRFIEFSDPLPGEAPGAASCSDEGSEPLAVDTLGCPTTPEPEDVPPEPEDAAVRILRVVHHARKARVQVRLECPAPRSFPCTGRVAVIRRPKRGTGSRAFEIEPGAEASVRVPLRGRDRRAWAKKKQGRVWVTDG